MFDQFLPIALGFVALAGLSLAAIDYLLRKRAQRGFPWWVWTGASVITLTCVPIAQMQANSARARIKNMVQGMGPTYVSELVRHGYLELSLDTPADDPNYLALIEMQKTWLSVNPSIADIYTMKRTADGQTALLLDSETDYDHSGEYDNEREGRTDIGEIYQDPSPAMEAAFAGKPWFDNEVSEDRWGMWVSAAYPVFDDAGRVHSILGIDFPAEQWIAAQQNAMLGVFATGGALILLSAGVGIIYRFGQRDVRARQLEAELAKTRLATAEDINHAKSMFFANMSHEIRSPLTAIMGFADLLATPDCDEDDRIVNASTIRRNSEHLLGILNDILDYSKIESGKFEIERLACSPFQIVEETIDMVHIRAKEKAIELKVEYDLPLPETIQTDPLRLKQVLLNLVGNAIKFTESGLVVLRVSAVAAATDQDNDQGSRIRFDISDTGIGMTPEQRQRIFAPFSQADSTMTRKFGGSGLGLAISRQLTNLMGGDITVRSELGKGTTFSVTVNPGNILQFRSIKSQDDIPSFRQPKDWAKELLKTDTRIESRILLAEDGPDNQRLIAYLLRKQGADVTIAGNGRIAMEAAMAALGEGNPFQIILMDMQMPEMDGYEATSTLRAKGYKLPIIALTAHALLGERDKCIKAGCDDYLTKPINKSQMLETINHYLRKGKGPSRKAA